LEYVLLSNLYVTRKHPSGWPSLLHPQLVNHQEEVLLSRTGLILFAVGSLSAGSALAQSAATPPSSTPPAVATTTTPPPANAPVAGANSFTEAQARKRIEEHGYSNVMNLKKDEQSIWRGTATKDGTSVPVALDFHGNVVSN
jgi:hypothetical protein